MVVGGGSRYSAFPRPLSTAGLCGQIFKDDINGFSSTSDVCFMLEIQGFVTNTGKMMVDANRPGGTVRHSQLPPLQAFHPAVQYVIHSFHL